MQSTKTMRKSWYQMPTTWVLAIIAVAAFIFFSVDFVSDVYEEAATPTISYEGVPAEYTETWDFANNVMATQPHSYEALRNFLVFYGHDEAAIDWTMNEMDARTDWYAQAVAYGNYLLEYNFDEDELFEALVNEWFTESQVSYAVSILTETE